MLLRRYSTWGSRLAIYRSNIWKRTPKSLGEEYLIRSELRSCATKLLARLRNRLVHDYDGTNWQMIANMLFVDLPQLIESLKHLVE